MSRTAWPDVDDVLYALTRTERHYCHSSAGALGTNQRAALSTWIDLLRDCLRRGDAIGFDARIDDLLARHPDRADFLLGALYEEMNIGTRAALAAAARKG